jgi:hypothetical protein
MLCKGHLVISTGTETGNVYISFYKIIQTQIIQLLQSSLLYLVYYDCILYEYDWL